MNLRAIAAVVVCLTWASLLQADPQQDAERKALLRLVSRLPRLDTSNVACPPFDAHFEWKAANGSYRADFRYRRPDHLDAMMTDGSDGSPCLLYTGKKVMIFEPAAPKFLIANDHMLDFGFREGDDGKVGFGANIGFGIEHVQRIRIDVVQVMQAAEGVLTNRKSTDSVIRLRQTRGDHRDELELQLTDSPVCTLKSFEGDRPEAVMSMELTVFPRESPPLFKMPDTEELARLIPVERLSNPDPDVGFLGMAAGMKNIALLFHAVYSHVALLEPSMRDEMKLPGLTTPDWDAVARHKREFGPKLRELCGLPAPSTSSDDVPLAPSIASEEGDIVK